MGVSCASKLRRHLGSHTKQNHEVVTFNKYIFIKELFIVSVPGVEEGLRPGTMFSIT